MQDVVRRLPPGNGANLAGVWLITVAPGDPRQWLLALREHAAEASRALDNAGGARERFRVRLDSEVPGVAQGLLLTIRPKMMLDVWVQQGQIRQISAAGGGEEVTIKLTDLGAGAAVAAPDPASTITAGQFDEYEAHADAG